MAIVLRTRFSYFTESPIEKSKHINNKDMISASILSEGAPGSPSFLSLGTETLTMISCSSLFVS